MDKRILQAYSTWAKANLENQIEVSLKALGIHGDNDIKKAKRAGDVTIIDGDPTSYPADLYGKRESIISLVHRTGYRNVIEEFAYTWFNRFVALRFMEVHGFLPHGFRVLSNPGGGIEPEILKELNLVQDDLELDMNLCMEYKRQGKIEELFRHVLIKQCDVLSKILPMLFSSDMGYLDLLLPKALLKGETVVTRLLEIPESAFLEEVDVIGWMYQFYISSKKDAVYASRKTITKDTLPAVTQLFTPDWIVRYMAQNSVGRLWLESYPDSALRSEMRYYVDDAGQTPEVQKKIDEIRYRNVKPEEIRIVEPCCGSGHILVYVFDLLYKMYEERGYQKRDIPTLILRHNLVGLDVDKRAAQMASFALVMKARSVNNRFFNDSYYEVPRVYELQDSKILRELEYRRQLRELKFLNGGEIKLIDELVDTFENGKTIGSLLKVKPVDFSCVAGALEKVTKNAVSSLFNQEFLSIGMKRLRELLQLAEILSAKYDVMITNPPYRPVSSMEAAVGNYALENYPNSKADLFAMFMETGFTKKGGFTAMINMQGWMSLSTYERLRESILQSRSIVVMAHLGPRAFDAISGEVVQTTSFVLRNCHFENFFGTYIDLVEGKSEAEKRASFLEGARRYRTSQNNFARIPGAPITAYWVSENVVKCFEFPVLKSVFTTREGMATAGNDIFLRYWYEVNKSRITFGCADHAEALHLNVKWVPYNKGGPARDWYGNNDYVVDWSNDGYAIKHNFDPRDKRLRSHNYNGEYGFREGLTWSAISSGALSVRYCEKGFLFDSKGAKGFCSSRNQMFSILGLLNSKVAMRFLRFLSPTLDFKVGDIISIPYGLKRTDEDVISRIVENAIELSREDWDSFEVSWNFKKHPLLPGDSPRALPELFDAWTEKCQKRFEDLKNCKKTINQKLIQIYDLQDELDSEIQDNDVMSRLAEKERDIKSLISYLIGLVMGRYSLNTEGLAYAGGTWDSANYTAYEPDDDGIVPIYNGIGMEDGLTKKIIELIKLIYGEASYRVNIDFIAEALGKNNNESSEETLNRYLNDGFYADHLKIYRKRPIYWLFTSGKKAGFKCLIYMHRYNRDTLARMNGMYFLPESARKKNELEELSGGIAHAEGRERLRLEKKRQNLAAAYNEAIEYGQVLDHMANKYISIDLDDGVKKNYAKFQGVEIVTDGGTKVKKDLLAPLK